LLGAIEIRGVSVLPIWFIILSISWRSLALLSLLRLFLAAFDWNLSEQESSEQVLLWQHESAETNGFLKESKSLLFPRNLSEFDDL